jgi:hypothetical protein
VVGSASATAHCVAFAVLLAATGLFDGAAVKTVSFRAPVLVLLFAGQLDGILHM